MRWEEQATGLFGLQEAVTVLRHDAPAMSQIATVCGSLAVNEVEVRLVPDSGLHLARELARSMKLDLEREVVHRNVTRGQLEYHWAGPWSQGLETGTLLRIVYEETVQVAARRTS